MDTFSQPELSTVEGDLHAIVRDGNAIEQAQAFGRAREYQLSTRRLAAMAGCSATHVRNMLRLLDLPAAVQLKIANGGSYRPYLTFSVQTRRREAVLESLDSAASRGCECLLHWCTQLELSGGYAERALREAKLQIRWEDRLDIPQTDAMWPGSPEGAFDRGGQPDYMQLTAFTQIYLAGVWLARTVVYLMRNSGAKRKALEMSLVEVRW